MKFIPLTKGQFAIVDDADARAVSAFRWYATSGRAGFYAARRESRKQGGKIILMHRVILEAPTGTQVDHMNMNGLDNRRSNIRLCTHTQNRANQNKSLKKPMTSRFKGVFFDRITKRWAAHIKIHRKYIWLGRHDTEEQAGFCYNHAARILFGEFARLNEVDAQELGQRSLDLLRAVERPNDE